MTSDKQTPAKPKKKAQKPPKQPKNDIKPKRKRVGINNTKIEY